MLVGLNPTLRKGKVSCVFELNKESSISKYIIDDILKPTGLKLEDTYATNLVKCTFPKNQEPGVICENTQGKKHNKTIRNFLSPFFHYCREHFEAEVHEIKPKIIISFGEIPHQLLVEAFDLDKQKVEKAMKNAFSYIYPVNLLGHKVCYAPCIRKKAIGHKLLKELFPEFIENLRKAVEKLKI
jgi:uracil-DNA glycosylase family 4